MKKRKGESKKERVSPVNKWAVRQVRSGEKERVKKSVLAKETSGKSSR